MVELELVEDCCGDDKVSLRAILMARGKSCTSLDRGTRIENRHVLVLPAASRPSISNRISFDPKILAIIFDIEAPIVSSSLVLVNPQQAMIERGVLSWWSKARGCGSVLKLLFRWSRGKMRALVVDRSARQGNCANCYGRV